MHSTSLASLLLSVAQWLVEFGVWFVLWCPVVALLEYATHRWIMHKVNRLLDPQLLQLKSHGKHHQGSNHHDLVDMPVVNGLRLTAPFLLAVLLWGYLVGPATSVLAPGLALLSWSFVYTWLWNRMHRAIHDVEANWFRRSGPLFRFFLNHHLQHHRHANVNFGTVFPWTDYVFRTWAPGIASPQPPASQVGVSVISVELAPTQPNRSEAPACQTSPS